MHQVLYNMHEAIYKVRICIFCYLLMTLEEYSYEAHTYTSYFIFKAKESIETFLGYVHHICCKGFEIWKPLSGLVLLNQESPRIRNILVLACVPKWHCREGGHKTNLYCIFSVLGSMHTWYTFMMSHFLITLQFRVRQLTLLSFFNNIFANLLATFM